MHLTYSDKVELFEQHAADLAKPRDKSSAG